MTTRIALYALTASAALAAGTALAAPALGPKASLACRGAIAQKGSGLVKTGLKLLDKCHASRDKGKLPLATDCNLVDAADPKDSFGAASQAKIAAAIAKKCLVGEPVLGNFAGGDPTAALFGTVRTEVEASGDAIQGRPDVVGQKAAGKCHKTIGKARSSIVAEIAKLAVKCQKLLDKAGRPLGALDPSCVPDPASLKSVARATASIAKACVGVLPADVDTCDPVFPDCLASSAIATGAALVAALYGMPAVCGNGTTEFGEICDDGDLIDGDGCDSNCTPTGCGNGIVTAPEQCDDGNALATDACVSCQDAVCGDGFVRAGIELCGDAPPAACTDPLASCPVGECTPAATMRSFSVNVTPPAGTDVAGLIVLVDYPETRLRIPGLTNESSVKARVTNLPSGFGEPSDLDFALRVSFASSGVIVPGRFFTVAFDDCNGATAPSLDELACLVEDASDPNGASVAGVICAVASP